MKVTVETPPVRWRFLCEFYRSIMIRAPIAGLELASTLVGESFERYLKKFTFRPKHLKLTVAEAMALRDCLVASQTEREASGPFVGTIIHELTHQINHASPP